MGSDFQAQAVSSAGGVASFFAAGATSVENLPFATVVVRISPINFAICCLGDMIYIYIYIYIYDTRATPPLLCFDEKTVVIYYTRAHSISRAADDKYLYGALAARGARLKPPRVRIVVISVYT